MKHLFVPYELAIQLKEKGFDEECIARWEYSPIGWNSYVAWGGVTELDEENDIKLLLTSNYLEKYYDNVIKAPLYQQVVGWFFEKYNISISAPNIMFGRYQILGGKHNINKAIEGDWGFKDEKCTTSMIYTVAIKEALKLLP